MKRVRNLAVVLATSAGGVLVMPAADAATAQQACVEDIRHYCNFVRSGHGRMNKCLDNFEQDLNDRCRDHRRAVRERVEKFNEACGLEIARFCTHKSKRPGADRVLACLKARQERLSLACRWEFEADGEAVLQADE